jgi:hypothetical protein
MDIVKELLRGIPLPRMVKVRQNFPVSEIKDVPASLREQLSKPGVGDRIKPGMRIAIAVGSRGVAEIPTLARVTAEEIKRRGGHPFIVPGMGSHGGATAEGQKEVLANLGVTEASAGCEILSSMEVVELGRLPVGLPVYMDKYAYEADGIVVINRVKPHTAFRGPNESGVAKMITIGLGKQKGAESCHAYGFGVAAEFIPAMARITLAKAPILFGVATVENAYDRIAKIVAMPAGELIETDAALLPEAKAAMARICFDDPIDVLIIDQIGKDISGDGADPNIMGRYPTPFASGGPQVSKMVILDLTEATHGNANGIGHAEFTTRKLVNKIDFPMTYANCLTSTVAQPGKLPIILEDDRDAILAAMKTCNARDLSKARVVRIKDTLRIGEIYISESMLAEAATRPQIEVIGSPAEMVFDAAGNLLDQPVSPQHAEPRRVTGAPVVETTA